MLAYHKQIDISCLLSYVAILVQVDVDTACYLQQGDNRTGGSKGIFQERINSEVYYNSFFHCTIREMEQSARRRHCRGSLGRLPGESDQCRLVLALSMSSNIKTRLYLVLSCFYQCFLVTHLFLPSYQSRRAKYVQR